MANRQQVSCKPDERDGRLEGPVAIPEEQELTAHDGIQLSAALEVGQDKRRVARGEGVVVAVQGTRVGSRAVENILARRKSGTSIGSFTHRLRDVHHRGATSVHLKSPKNEILADAIPAAWTNTAPIETCETVKLTAQ